VSTDLVLAIAIILLSVALLIHLAAHRMQR